MFTALKNSERCAVMNLYYGAVFKKGESCYMKIRQPSAWKVDFLPKGIEDSVGHVLAVNLETGNIETFHVNEWVTYIPSAYVTGIQ